MNVQRKVLLLNFPPPFVRNKQKIYWCVKKKGELRCTRVKRKMNKSLLLMWASSTKEKNKKNERWSHQKDTKLWKSSNKLANTQTHRKLIGPLSVAAVQKPKKIMKKKNILPVQQIKNNDKNNFESELFFSTSLTQNLSWKKRNKATGITQAKR